MTEIAFHVNLAQPLAYTQRLLAKVLERDMHAAVLAEDDFIQQLSQQLWAAQPTSFMPHCMAHAPAAEQLVCRLVLCTQAAQLADLPSAFTVLLQCQACPEPPEGFARFARVLELVGADESVLKPARSRWKYYEKRGYALQKHAAAGAST